MRRIALVSTLLAAVLAMPASAQAIEQNCELALTRFDPDSVNTLFPDDSAQYWSSRYTAVPGTRIRISGEYPHTRYMSWNIYDPALRPFDHLADIQIQPDPGSTNPFLPKARRYSSPRSYAMFIEFTPKPASPAPNTIYVDPAANPRGLFTYRTYIPDRGFKADGGVGLPHVEWEGVPAGGPDCKNTEKPTSTTMTDTYATLDGPPTGPPYPGRATPTWHKFVNLCVSGDDLLFDNEPGDSVDSGGESPCSNFGSGGFLSNMDNAYTYMFISRGFGPLVVIHGKAPTFPDTRDGARRMPSGKQLRYWSFCQNDPYSQRYIDCLADDQVKLNRDGTYTIVVSRPADRPPCAKNWLSWGPQTQGVLIYRNMLPDPGFSAAIQNAEYGSEQASMGAYYPSPRYATSSSELGC